MKRGKLFEIGPDGFGYLIDLGTAGRSYAIHMSVVEGVPVPQVDLEDAEVTFTMEGDKPTNIRFHRLGEPAHLATGVGRGGR